MASTEALDISNQRISNALINGELRLLYQPKVSVVHGGVLGMEAFLRWRPDRDTEIGPAAFLPAVHRQGRSRELTLYVLQQALTALAEWRANGKAWHVSLNLSIADLIDDSLPASIELRLSQMDLPPQALIVEVPEVGLPRDWQRILPVIHDLRAIGVGIAFDGGGNDIFALDELDENPFTEVKFTGNGLLQFAATTNATGFGLVPKRLRFANKHGLRTVAVGAETEDDLDMIRSLGFDAVQGNNIAAPSAADDVLDWAAAWTPDWPAIEANAQHPNAAEENSPTARPLGPVPPQPPELNVLSNMSDQALPVALDRLMDELVQKLTRPLGHEVRPIPAPVEDAPQPEDDDPPPQEHRKLREPAHLRAIDGTPSEAVENAIEETGQSEPATEASGAVPETPAAPKPGPKKKRRPSLLSRLFSKPPQYPPA